LELQKGVLSEWGEKLHHLINRKFPYVWRWLYLNKTFTDLTLPFAFRLASKNNEKVLSDFSAGHGALYAETYRISNYVFPKTARFV
jgi:hypothetical protein